MNITSHVPPLYITNLQYHNISIKFVNHKTIRLCKIHGLQCKNGMKKIYIYIFFIENEVFYL